MPLTKERPWVLAALLGVVLLSVGLRLIPVLFLPSLNWDDEIFQATEPAHRLVFGYGIVAWEFQLGMRSWILPGTIAGLMQLSRLIGDGPAYYLPLIATALALLASAPVLCCFLWARRWYGPVPALAGGIVVAVAPELVYFGGRALTEVVAAYPDHRLLAARPGLRDGLSAAIVRRGPSVRAGLPAAHPARAGRRDHHALAALARVANKAGRGARRRARRHHGRSNARFGDGRRPARLARAQPALQPCLRRRQRIRHLALGLLPLPRSDHLASRPRACAS